MQMLAGARTHNRAAVLQSAKGLCDALRGDALLPPSCEDGSQQPTPLLNFCTLLTEVRVLGGSTPATSTSVAVLRVAYILAQQARVNCSSAWEGDSQSSSEILAA
jgi:hypothetical protein